MNTQIAMLIRFVLLLLAGILISKGILKSEQQDTFVTALETITGGLISLITLFWSWTEKKSQANAINTALALPSHSTPFDLKEAISGAFGFKELLIQQAINTILSLLKDRVKSSKFNKSLIILRDALNQSFPE